MTTTYTFEQLKEDVKKEAEALRVHATEEEREKLDIDRLVPSWYDQCVYGLITGDCFNRRASELIFKCCPKYFKDEDSEGNDFCDQVPLGKFADFVNGDKIEGIDSGYKFYKHRESPNNGNGHYSAIEAYILLPEAKNANLIAYLRGETDTLEL